MLTLYLVNEFAQKLFSHYHCTSCVSMMYNMKATSVANVICTGLVVFETCCKAKDFFLNTVYSTC